MDPAVKEQLFMLNILFSFRVPLPPRGYEETLKVQKQKKGTYVPLLEIIQIKLSLKLCRVLHVL
jgi:hypothetical protein